MNKIKIYVLSTQICLVFVAIAVTALSLSISNVNALTNVEAGSNDTGFSIDIPDNWAYEAKWFAVELTPSEFGELLIDTDESLNEKMKDEGAMIGLYEEKLYPIENAPLDVYIKYKVDDQSGMNVTANQNVTVGGEPAVKIYADGIAIPTQNSSCSGIICIKFGDGNSNSSFSGIKFVEYMLMHNEQPYIIIYRANEKDFEKYLPEFEQIVKSFKFRK